VIDAAGAVGRTKAEFPALGQTRYDRSLLHDHTRTDADPGTAFGLLTTPIIIETGDALGTPAAMRPAVAEKVTIKTNVFMLRQSLNRVGD
jgi:hypothetical protein